MCALHILCHVPVLPAEPHSCQCVCQIANAAEAWGNCRLWRSSGEPQVSQAGGQQAPHHAGRVPRAHGRRPRTLPPWRGRCAAALDSMACQCAFCPSARSAVLTQRAAVSWGGMAARANGRACRPLRNQGWQRRRRRCDSDIAARTNYAHCELVCAQWHERAVVSAQHGRPADPYILRASSEVCFHRLWEYTVCLQEAAVGRCARPGPTTQATHEASLSAKQTFRSTLDGF